MPCLHAVQGWRVDGSGASLHPFLYSTLGMSHVPNSPLGCRPVQGWMGQVHPCILPFLNPPLVPPCCYSGVDGSGAGHGEPDAELEEAAGQRGPQDRGDAAEPGGWGGGGGDRGCVWVRRKLEHGMHNVDHKVHIAEPGGLGAASGGAQGGLARLG